ncbi:uncharacterized protein BO72DRAFT_452249 [Aspergillus fijiensis CBS 313.89]|uniref:Sex determining protein n=1 Tax=Aspergillus fijiensis CBS 313.89 TaxID=1448319 RepID=A0A8G1RGN1_9EURO|nr:uncharacterized protein BO72DRAFT_452249 [Aspergillus fijiensis CBS 313.89]RAK72879.1 hypothetical protein BO72DRAFT_452249 [Aspergillus fijiensis CBS 313.89]
MSMYPWHGSTATTSTGHRTHPHPQQQQQQQHRHQRQHLPHLPHHTANAAAPAAAAAAASNPRIDSTSTTITPTAAPPSTSAAALQMPQMPWLPSMISARANPQHATLPNLSTNLRLRPQPTPQPTALDTQQQHQHHSHPHSLSRHSQQQQQQQQPVPMVIDARQQQQQQQQKQKQRQQKQQQAVSISSEESDFDTSDCSVRHITTADALGDQDYVSSDGMGANTIARARSHARAQQQQQRRHGHHPVGGGNGGTANSTATATPSSSQRDGPIPNGNATTTRSRTTTTTILIDDRDDLDLDATAAGNDSADNSLNITGDREGPRKHGKRLTTLEEVSLFDICNRHAHEFGQRSNLCKWWMTVTEEFTRDQGHPYSWHSVRRKVELVTKQRMKFLDEQRERGGSESDDRSNLRWRTAVDAWVPTWQRWEEAEARRIEKRDSRRPRKRKDREWEVWVNGNNDGVSPSLGAWRATRSVSGSGSPLVNVGGAAAQVPTPSQQALSTPPASTPQHTKVRLPPGFDNMFASQPQSQYHTPTPAPATMLGGASGGRPSLDGSLALQQLNSTPSGGEAGNAESSSSMMSAVLETLGKLNRHLDAANPTTTLQTSFKPSETTDSRSRAATTAAAATAQQQQPQQPSQSQPDTSSNPDDPPSPTQAPKMSQVSSLPIPTHLIAKLKTELREEMREEMRSELAKDRASLEEKLDSVQRTQEMILEMLRQEPS